jgi:hypothetical protein
MDGLLTLTSLIEPMYLEEVRVPTKIWYCTNGVPDRQREQRYMHPAEQLWEACSGGAE